MTNENESAGVPVATLREVIAKATPTPWRDDAVEIVQLTRGSSGEAPSDYYPDSKTVVEMVGAYTYSGCTHKIAWREADRALIVAAVNALGALLDELERLRNELGR